MMATSPVVRAPVDHIHAPALPPRLPWINDTALRAEQHQASRPVLIEFWDFCRVNSIRTLPYMQAWHERYAADGLRVIGVHSPGFPPSEDPEAVRAAVERLGITYPIVVDVGHEVWRLYDNLGWPARYLWNGEACLFEYHYGEGAYADTELAIQELLGLTREPLAPLRPEDVPGAEVAPQSEDVAGPYSGPYEAGGVWAVLDGHGTVTANGRELEVEHPGAFPLIEHPRHTEGVLELEVGDGVTCYAVCFTPGVA
jgi:thiol-disulfide isomerase/thioredoxin